MSVSSTGSGLHWMRQTQAVYAALGAEAAVLLFGRRLRTLHAGLSKLSQRTTVVYKLIDDIRVR